MTYNRCLYPGTVQQGGVAVYASMFTASLVPRLYEASLQQATARHVNLVPE